MQFIATLLIATLPFGAFAFDVPCLDPLACNFMEEGECFFTDETGFPCVIQGCTIQGACNFDPEADLYDGSCDFVSCLGCMDVAACNYDVTALYDDATCIYYVDCNGTCGGDWIEDACGNCYPALIEFELFLTNCGAAGRFGPSQEQCYVEYGNALVAVEEGVQRVVIPHSGSYLIATAGAQGGNGSEDTGSNGGNGAYMSGHFELTEGDTLNIVVGQMGTSSNGGGGGGGTFVWVSNGELLVAAGGGGGGGDPDQSSLYNGGNGVSTMNASPSRSGSGHGGNDGYGGGTGNSGGGGCGWLSNGVSGTGGGGFSMTSGFLGGMGDTPGGFGGGGANGAIDAEGGGGGGGYSGGGGGDDNNDDGGGGGGSFNSGQNQENYDAWNIGHGFVQVVALEPDIPVCTPGCTSIQSCNYNPESNFDDGSCDYCFCLEGTQWSDSLQGCISIPSTSNDACGPGTIWDEGAQACLPDNTCTEDLNMDGVFGTADLLQLLSVFGDSCVDDE